MNDETQYTFDRVARLLIGAATIVAVFALLRYLADVLLPFAAAVVLAYLLNPLVTLLEGKAKRRGLAVATTIVGLGLGAVILVVAVVPMIVGQVQDTAKSLERLRRDAMVSAGPARPAAEGAAEESGVGTTEGSAPAISALGWRELKEAWAEYRRDAELLPRAERVARLRARIKGTYVGVLADRAVAFAETEAFSEFLARGVRRVLAGGWTVASFFVNVILGLTGLIVVLLYLVFLLLDYPAYARTWRAFLPPRYREPIGDFLDQFMEVLRRYFRGQAVVALSVGVLLAIGFSLIGLPMAVPFGLFVGALNMVPYLQTVGLVPAMALAALRSVEGDSSFLASVLLTLLVFAVVQMIQDGLLVPAIMGKATGLRPVSILLGVFVWGKLLGPLGLLLAIPLTCLGIAYYRRYVLLRGPAALPSEA
jgi:predicted PurR-regulated permease PerM